MRLTEAAPAKLNLALHVRSRRADGYHMLETLFAFVDDGDLLSASPAVDLSLTIDGPMAAGLAADADNLVMRAAHALGRAAGVDDGAALHLAKNLPVASGIGGGSADAAAALRLLNRLWGLHWPLERLAELAEQLGADVPACVYARAMLARGVGERLEPVNLGDLARAPVLLANPMRAVSTGPVFKAWDGVDRGGLGNDISLSALREARNDLQPGAIGLCPEIEDVIQALEECPGALLVRMSGSGATCLALFADQAGRDAAHLQLRRRHAGWWLLGTALRK